MQSNSKQSPKSCGCRTCRRGKASTWGNFAMRVDERAFRREARTALMTRPLDEIELAPAPRGGYYD